MIGRVDGFGSRARVRTLGGVLFAAVAFSTGLMAAVALAAGARHSHASGPAIVSLSLTPGSVGKTGGSVHLKATVKRSSSCTVSSTPHLSGLPKTHSCSSGHLSLTLHVGAAPGGLARHLTVTLKASKSGHHATRSVHLGQLGAGTGQTATNPTPTTPTSTTPTSTTSTTPTTPTTPTNTSTTPTTPTNTTPIATPASSDVPLPAGGVSGSSANGVLNSVSCPAVADCVAVGYYTDGSGYPKALIETFNGTNWTATEAPLPSDVSTSEPYSELTSVSCYSPTACVAVGDYLAAGFEPYVVVLSGTTWTWETASTPVDTSNPTLRQNGQLNQVSCAADGKCIAVGFYNPPSQKQQLIETPGNGSWTGSQAPLPNDADSTSTTNVLNSVSCSVSNATDYCTAVGAYVVGGNGASLGETLSGGVWTPTELDPQLPNFLGSDTTVSCFGSACAAAGEFNSNKPWFQATSAGVWNSGVAVAEPSNSTNAAEINDIDCASSSSCVAVGGYYDNPSSDYVPLIDTGSGSSYTPTEAPLPSNQTTGNPNSNLAAVSCATTSTCLAIGDYDNDNGGALAGVVETGSGSSWTATAQPAPPSGGSFLPLKAIACVASWGCVAVGDYQNTSGGVAGVALTLPL